MFLLLLLSFNIFKYQSHAHSFDMSIARFCPFYWIFISLPSFLLSFIFFPARFTIVYITFSLVFLCLFYALSAFLSVSLAFVCVYVYMCVCVTDCKQVILQCIFCTLYFLHLFKEVHSDCEVINIYFYQNLKLLNFRLKTSC